MITFQEWLHQNHPVARAAQDVKSLVVKGLLEKATDRWEQYVRLYKLTGEMLRWFSHEAGMAHE